MRGQKSARCTATAGDGLAGAAVLPAGVGVEPAHRLADVVAVLLANEELLVRSEAGLGHGIKALRLACKGVKRAYDAARLRLCIRVDRVPPGSEGQAQVAQLFKRPAGGGPGPRPTQLTLCGPDCKGESTPALAARESLL